ncbi:MAG: exodeoxyribonuclease V subunit gamma [Chloroflexi bacterium]|nr:exodeoxyribonuclease V subunit gamma [Chloroflexota bacterium]
MPSSTPNLDVVYAARTELLLDALVRAVETPLGDPTQRECIVVQNHGMARWLELQLSARLGIWANPWFPFPEAFAYRLWRDLSPTRGGGGRDRFGREGLTWSIAAALPELLDLPDFAPLRGWLGRGADPTRVMALSRRIARVFDGYLLSRPELLIGWEDGPESAWLPADLPAAALEDARWQARLWRAVVARGEAGAEHPGRRIEALVAALERLPEAGPGPGRDRLWRYPRVSVFGLSALSPSYLRILAALARSRPVRLYSLAASPADARRLEALVRRAGWDPADSLTEADLETALALEDPARSHPLVVDQGRAARAFQVLLAQHGARALTLPDRTKTEADGGGSGAGWDGAADGAASEAGGAARFEAGPESLLARLQADLALGRAPSPQPGLLAAVVAGRDRSIGLHSCHGPLREVEVLRDQLLLAFDELEDLAPHEVVVMAPDVEAYAPYVEAIFGTGRSEGLAIPFRIADRSPRAEAGAAQAFARALHLLRGRMTAPELLDLLALEPVRQARGLGEEGIETLREWVESVGIRWGLDAAHREAVGQPAMAANTWRWGLNRLALGWAAPGDGRARFRGVLPEPAAGGEPLLLGALADLWDLLARWRDELLEARLGLPDWADRLARLLRELVGDGAPVEEARAQVESALGALVERAREAGYAERLGLDAITDLVAAALDEEPPARGFLEGAVTVCALQPMRAIPFRVVALLGMNDGAFPRGERPLGFDLAARRPRLGDPLARAADRLLFLEALSCARERLLISWTGRLVSNDAALPPSVVVSELLDSLSRMTGASTTEGGEAAGGLLLEHPLHPFSPRYFVPEGRAGHDPRWFSYAGAFAGTAGLAAGPRRARPALLGTPLLDRPDGAPAEAVRLEALARFLEAPARRVLRDRLGIDLPERDAPMAEREPMVLGGLERYRVGESILAALRAGADPAEALAIAVAEGRLPLGTPGRLALQPLEDAARRLLALAAPLCQGGPARSAPIQLDFPAPDVGLVGRLDQLWPAGRVELGFGRLDARRELRLWVRHLALNAAVEAAGISDCAPQSWAIGRAEKGDAPTLLHLCPVPDSRARLAELLALWREAETQVPPFYPLAARAFLAAGPPSSAASMAEQAAIEAALRAAGEAFGAGRSEADPGAPWTRQVDLDEPHLALALGDALPWNEDGELLDPALAARFARLARMVYEPLDAAATRFDEAQAQARLAALEG